MIGSLILVSLVVAAGTADRTGRAGALTLAALSVLWLVVSDGLEGPVVWRITADNGLTATDFVGFAGLGLAAWRWRRA